MIKVQNTSKHINQEGPPLSGRDAHLEEDFHGVPCGVVVAGIAAPVCVVYSVSAVDAVDEAQEVVGVVGVADVEGEAEGL